MKTKDGEGVEINRRRKVKSYLDGEATRKLLYK